MKETVTIGAQEYFRPKAVASLVGYTPDYLVILAKKKEIDAQKIGSRWYVTKESVFDFKERVETEKRRRNQQASIARKRELMVYQQPKQLARTALAQTLVILILGFAVGTGGYATHQAAAVYEGDENFLAYLARSLYEFVTPPAIQTYETVAISSLKEEDQNSAIFAQSTTTQTAILIAPDALMTESHVAAIRDSLSDDVSISVDPDHPDTGIIIPHFKSRDGEAYRFLLAPIHPPSG